jgi:hypothetical protein
MGRTANEHQPVADRGSAYGQRNYDWAMVFERKRCRSVCSRDLGLPVK